MRKLLIVPVALLGASILLSGCFIFTGIKLSKVKVNPGKKSVATIYTRANDLGRDHPFLFVAISQSGVKPAGPKKFDVKGKFTKNGLKLKKDNDLRDFIISEYDESCGGVPTDSADTDYYAFVTQKRVKDGRKRGAQAMSKLGFKQKSLTDGPVTAIGVATGGADSDNDGDYEGTPDTDTGCSGGVQTSIRTKPVPTRAQQGAAERDFAEAYLEQEAR